MDGRCQLCAQQDRGKEVYLGSRTWLVQVKRILASKSLRVGGWRVPGRGCSGHGLQIAT